MLDYWSMKQFAEERQSNYLKEAESYRIACQVENGRRVHASSLSHMVTELGGLLISKVRQYANRSTVSPTEASADAYREIVAG
jgi:hypothetical protein